MGKYAAQVAALGPEFRRNVESTVDETLAKMVASGALNERQRVALVDALCEQVFREAVKTARGRGYGRLTGFLNEMPEQQAQLVLTFAEIGQIVGHDLPASAFQQRTWWANATGNPHGAAWLASGWKIDRVFLPARTAVFRRESEDLVHLIPKYVDGLLNGTSRLAKLHARDLARWIRFCRRVGWFFEATALYERSGVSFDALPEMDRAELEEDYSACKRELLRYRSDAGTEPQPVPANS